MLLRIDDEFATICLEIVEQNLTAAEWSKIESDDWFQTSNYVGGFDAIEQAFCFTYTSQDGAEYWFQITLLEVDDIVAQMITYIQTRPAAVLT